MCAPDGVGFALLYIIFAALFLRANFRGLQVETSSEMFDAVSSKLEDMPYQLTPRRTFSDISNSQDIYDWLKAIIVEVPLNERAKPGEINFCTPTHPCGIDRGPVEEDAQCAKNLTAGDSDYRYERVRVNGYLWDREDIIKTCRMQDVQINIGNVAGEYGPQEPNAGGKRCMDPLTNTTIIYVHVLDSGNRGGNCPSFIDSMYSCCQCPSDLYNASLPGSNLLQQEADISDFIAALNRDSPRSSTIGYFNNLLVTRLTLKRFKMRANTDDQWVRKDGEAVIKSGHFPAKLNQRDSAVNLDYSVTRESVEARGVENISSFKGVYSGREYVWQLENSRNDAGGYVHFLSPSRAKADLLREVTILFRDQWFNMQMGALAVDLLMYNGNVEKFMIVSFVFSFNFAGNVERRVEVKPFDLALYPRNMDGSFVPFAEGGELSPFWDFQRILLEAAVVVLVGYFIMMEGVKITIQRGFYFQKFTSFIDLMSLGLCTLYIFSQVYFVFRLVPQYSIATLPLDENLFPKQFYGLEALADYQKYTRIIIGFNLLLIFVRLAMLIRELSPKLGLLTSVIGGATVNLFWFFLMFGIFFFGFAFFAYFTFGAGFEKMSTPGNAIFESACMLFGRTNFSELRVADSLTAPFFFYFFYILFFFILLNMFISIVLTAYDIEVLNLPEGGQSVLQQVATFIILPFKACFKGSARAIQECLPFVTSATSLVKSLGVRATKTPDGGRQRAPTDEHVEEDTEKGKKSADPLEKYESVVMLLLMMVFLYGMGIILRGEEVYYGMQSSLRPTADSGWYNMNPLREMDFDSIQSWQDVYDWAHETFVNDYYAQENMRCGVRGEDSKRLHYIAKQEGVCDNTRDGSTRPLHLVRDKAISFMDTTFVRLTIQHACFSQHPSARWQNGYPYVRRPGVQSPSGSIFSPTGSGYTELLENSGLLGSRRPEACLNFDGATYDHGSPEEYVRQYFKDPELAIFDTDTDVNLAMYMVPGNVSTYQQQGGFAIPLGIKQTDAAKRLLRLYEDRWFSQNSISMVFDWVTYNPNLDLFIYHEVNFFLKTTGKLTVERRSLPVPVNIYEAGGWYSVYRGVQLPALQAVYLLLVLFSFIILVKAMVKEFQLTKSGTFLIDFYKNDVWNISDTISLVLSSQVVLRWIQYYIHEFRGKYQFKMSVASKYQIPPDQVSDYNIPPENDSARNLFEDWYILMQFEDLAARYEYFIMLASLNSFFICIKVLKYIGNNPALPRITPLAGTLGAAMQGIMNFTAMIVILLLGFACNSYVLFGTSVPAFGSLPAAMTTLFLFITGNFEITTPSDPIVGMLNVVIFMVFMIFFYMIFVNLFLATMMANYAKTVSANDVRRVEEEIENRKKKKISEGKAGGASKKHAGSFSDGLSVNNWRSVSAAYILDDLVKNQQMEPLIEDEEEGSDVGEDEEKEEDDDDEAAFAESMKRARSDFLSDMLFSRVGDERVVLWAEGEEAHPPPNVDFLDGRELLQHLQNVKPTGEEFWLDALVTQVERSNGDNLLAECFQTEEMKASGVGVPQQTRDQQLREFDQTAELAFRQLEAKARQQYYSRVSVESTERQKALRRQCEIVNTYAEMLEHNYADLLEEIVNLETTRGELTSSIENILPDIRADHHTNASKAITV